MKTPFVSVIVPCRNEAGYIAACLDTVLASDYPGDRLEVLVVDGLSDDGTRAILAEYGRRFPQLRLLDNPKGIVPTALNLGLAAARGDVIVRMDAHCRYPPDYVTGLVAWLERTGADNVGAAWTTRAADGSPTATAIALALAHPFGIGDARFRLGTRVPRRVDTVPFGCYRREVFARLGGFDEELIRNQDDEFNFRLQRAGGVVLLVPGLQVDYYARRSLRQVARMYWQYGLFKPLVIRKTGRVMTLRQLAPATFVLALATSALLAPWSVWAGRALAAIAGSYAALALASAARVAATHGPRCALMLAATFPVLHLSYGAGFLLGAARLLRRQDVLGGARALRLSR